MIQEPVETSWLFLACVAIGIIIALISSVRILSILGFTSAGVRALLGKILQGYRRQSLPDVLEALGHLSKGCPESGLLSFIETGKDPSLAGFPRATRVASIYFNARLSRARRASALIKSTVVMLCLVFLWQLTRMLQATLTGISMERKTETWVLAERARQALAVSGPTIAVVALLYALFCFFRFRLKARKAHWEEFSQQVERSIEESPSSPQ